MVRAVDEIAFFPAVMRVRLAEFAGKRRRTAISEQVSRPRAGHWGGPWQCMTSPHGSQISWAIQLPTPHP